MASTGECGGTAVAPATAWTPKFGAACLRGWPERLNRVAEKGVRYLPWPDELEDPRSPPLPPPGRPVLESSGAPGARGACGSGCARGLPRSPLCGGRRASRSGLLATWAGPSASGPPRGDGG